MLAMNSHIHHHLSNTNREDDTETFKIQNTTSAEPLPPVTPWSLVLCGDNFEVYVIIIIMLF